MSAPLLIADSGPLIALARLDLLSLPKLLGTLSGTGYFLPAPAVEQVLAELGE